MKLKLYQIYFIFITILIIVITFYFNSLKNYNIEMIEKGNLIVHNIEVFRKKYGYLPDSLNEIGNNEFTEDPFYYNKLDSINYVISFPLGGVGESMTYFSNSRKWDEN